MSPKSPPLKRYIYISQRKIGMYDAQIPRPWWYGITNFLSRISFKFQGLELSSGASYNLEGVSQYQRMQQIIAQIKKNQNIGTIAQPAAYIYDTLPLFQVMFPSHPEYHQQKGDPGFVYFGGGTNTTSLGLIGAPRHLIGAAPNEPGVVSSDLPMLIEYVNKRLNEIIPGTTKRTRRDDGLHCIWYYDQYCEKPRSSMEFFASRIAIRLEHDGFIKNMLFYTPLYVAYKD